MATRRRREVSLPEKEVTPTHECGTDGVFVFFLKLIAKKRGRQIPGHVSLVTTVRREVSLLPYVSEVF